jgi:hypothetical protein
MNRNSLQNVPPRWRTALALGAGCLTLLCVASPANAGVYYSVKANSVNGVPRSGLDQTAVFELNAGDVVSIEIFANVTGAVGNSALEGFQRGTFSLISENLTKIPINFLGGFVPSTAFQASFQAGFVQDLDGDGDFDLGSKATGAGANANPTLSGLNLVRVDAGAMQTNGTPIAYGQAFDLGSVTFSVGAPLQSWKTILDVTPAGFSGSAMWEQDGQISSSSVVSKSFGDGLYMTSAPEPSTAALLVIGLLGMLANRARSQR